VQDACGAACKVEVGAPKLLILIKGHEYRQAQPLRKFHGFSQVPTEQETRTLLAQSRMPKAVSTAPGATQALIAQTANFSGSQGVPMQTEATDLSPATG
jgi:hypothetical protein